MKVAAVAAGFFIKTGFTSVATPCPAGRSSVANSNAAQADGTISCLLACASNCLNCNYSGAGKCDVCNNDYYIDPNATDIN